MPFADLPTIRLYYECGGDPAGPPLLFINGTGGDLRAEPSVMTWPIADDFDLLAYDQRGLGQSEMPDGPYSMSDYAHDALALVDHIGWDQFRVIGISFGGMVAQELALLAGDRVERLALCCTSSGGAGGASFPLHELEALDDDERVARQLELSDARFTREWQSRHPDIVELFRARRAAGDGPRRQLEARAGHDTFDRLSAINAPTLVCAGHRDRIAPLSNSEAIAGQIRSADLRVFDGGHLFFVQDATAWPTIVEFLRSPEG